MALRLFAGREEVRYQFEQSKDGQRAVAHAAGRDVHGTALLRAANDGQVVRGRANIRAVRKHRHLDCTQR